MKNKSYSVVGLALSLSMLSGCNYNSGNADGDNMVNPLVDDNIATFRVEVKNLSANQPLSPIAIVSHGSAYSAWAIGDVASNGLEQLAEGGDNSIFIMEASAAAAGTVSGEAPIGPGGSDMAELEVDLSSQNRLTVVSMLVNTNDAYTGTTGLSIESLDVGDSLTRRLPIYDAGTEANSEGVGTIPGPADGGEGYNSDRDDVNFVAMHPGVVSTADGYDLSVLDSTHRFDSPVVELVITRL